MSCWPLVRPHKFSWTAIKARAIAATVLILTLLIPGVPMARAYAVLTHEAVVDSAWNDAIRPALLQRFPNATPEDLKNARSFAYGGCAIQDMGYYPFGSKFFSDLVHYVRTGDFIEALLRDSQNINDYAFALGALAHYAADNAGHKLAVNRAVPILYPKLRRKYGDVVTYDENPAAHLQTEFGFDVLQVAKGHYAPTGYHDYIGFQVSEPLLEEAFQETYSMDLKSIFTDFDFAIGSYRRGVSKVIPEMTKVAWKIKKDDIQKEFPGITREQFLYNLSRRDYEHEWGPKYKRTGIGTKLLELIVRLIPKIGPFRTISFRIPTPETEKMFNASFDATLAQYEGSVRQQSATGQLDLRNDNFDTGTETGPGEYPLADATYAELLHRLAERQFAGTTAPLRNAILKYYSEPLAGSATKKQRREWEKAMKDINELKAFTPAVGGS